MPQVKTSHPARARSREPRRPTRRSRRCAGRRPERLERHRPEPGDRDPADVARPDPRHRDGAGGGVRRGERDRSRLRAVPARSRKLKAQPFGSQDAAIATAAHNVLVAIVDPARVAELDAAYAKTLEPIPSGATKDEGIRVGAAAAAAMLAARATDGYLAPVTLDLSADAGRWRPLTAAATDPDAWVGNLKPFVIESPSEFRSKGPNALTSAAYTKDFDEVKAIGRSRAPPERWTRRRPRSSGSRRPRVIYNRLARDLSAARGLDTRREARLLAMVNLAAADAGDRVLDKQVPLELLAAAAAIQEAATDGTPTRCRTRRGSRCSTPRRRRRRRS